MGLGGLGAGDNSALDDKGVHEEASGKKFGLCYREDYLKTMYRRREYEGVQYVPIVVVPVTRTHTGR